MTRARLTITQSPPCIHVRGRGAGRILTDGGFRGLYVGTVGGYVLDDKRLGDLSAWLDYRNIPFSVTTAAGGDAA